MKPNELKEADEDGRTILHWVAEINNERLASVILKKLPNLIGVEDHYENTPLILAEIYNSTTCVNLFKEFTERNNYDQNNENTLLGETEFHT